MIQGKEGWRNILISIVVISSAFAIQDLTLRFFLTCLAIVSLSYLAHTASHEVFFKFEGMKMKTKPLVIGAIAALVSGILSGGLAVIAAPVTVKLRRRETENWMKNVEASFEREAGLVSVSGSMINIVIATVFFGLFSYTGSSLFWLVSLINFWMSVSNMIPTQQFEGGYVAVWSGWMWFMIMVNSAIGIGGLLLLA